MDIKKLKELIEFMKDNDLIELEVEEEGKKVKLTRSGAKKIIQTSLEAAQETAAHHSQSKQKQTQENLVEIKAPMVGTFYRAPSPNEPAYIEIGNKIEPGKVVCIIEAMKLMNEIKSEIQGEIIDVLAENGEPVEYGQALFLVKPL